MIGNNVGHDGEHPCGTRATQRQKCGKSTLIDNMTPNDDSNGEKQHQRQEQDSDRINQCQNTHNPRQR